MISNWEIEAIKELASRIDTSKVSINGKIDKHLLRFELKRMQKSLQFARYFVGKNPSTLRRQEQ